MGRVEGGEMGRVEERPRREASWGRRIRGREES